MKKTMMTAVCLILVLLFCAAAAEETVATYEELLACDGTQTLCIEAVIGEVRVYGRLGKTVATFDLWIRAENGYGYERKTVSDVTAYPHAITSGLRVVYELAPRQGGSFTPKQILSYRIIEEDADWKAISAEYMKAHYPVIPYGELMERIGRAEEISLCAEGVYTLEIAGKEGRHIGLLEDGDGNLFQLAFDEQELHMRGPEPGDRVTVYGTIQKAGVLYEYTSETGTRMIPRIHARFLEMPKDE